MTSPAPDRLWAVDALRGLMLVLMTITHLPTRFSSPLGQPFGYVSAAEGFVLLSGFMAGLVYTRRNAQQGALRMRKAFWQRAWKIYLCQGALMVFACSAIALVGLELQHDAATNLVSFFLESPLDAVLGGILLVYSPALLDILPMYVLFLLVSPLLLLHGLHQGWGRVLAGSVALWLAAQFGLGAALYEAIAAPARLRIPVQQTGAFVLLAWQLPWVLGLWLGAQRAAGAAVPAFPRWLVAIALVLAACSMAWRHTVGQTPFADGSIGNVLFDKWQIGPLRLLNLFALLVLVTHFGPWLTRHLPRLRILELLGSASLPVFCAHLVLALLALAFLDTPWNRPWWIDLVLLAGSLAILLGVAWASRQLDRRAAALAAQVSVRRAQRQEPPPATGAER